MIRLFNPMVFFKLASAELQHRLSDTEWCLIGMNTSTGWQDTVLIRHPQAMNVAKALMSERLVDQFLYVSDAQQCAWYYRTGEVVDVGILEKLQAGVISDRKLMYIEDDFGNRYAPSGEA